MIKSQDVSIRSFSREDILPLVEYWTDSSEEFFKQRGVDKSKIKSREDFIETYEAAFRENGEVRTMATIFIKGKSVGVHTLTDMVENELAVFHAHIWKEVNRGIGVGVFSYLKASDFFMKKLNLKKIIFKTPKLNRAANRLKEKIGIPCVGDTVFDNIVLIKPLEAYLYELDRELLEQLKVKHGI